MSWIHIAQVTCLAVVFGILVILYDLDHKTPSALRYGLFLVSILFGGVFGSLFHNCQMQTHADAIAFVGVGVMVITYVLYMILHQYHLTVIRFSGSCMIITMLLLIVGSCSESNRQKQQIEAASAPIVAGK
ncbi:hypothetical protein [Spirosoma foliorum]|uniref:Uncharacterized protein n=1 Tax=Spirosoma foliorum TaxID=2710596 RepID=A0A7G5H2L4_9BACT|nr:hypothetical protein [Spirosoma foliorum]QMW05356.1 hypothetical protein H3H32_10925 [Spirosoma foliorum]